jgi:5-aminolevulinate synthase
LPPALTYGALASVKYLQLSCTERNRQKQQVETLKRKLREANLPILEGDTHIVPVMINNADKCTRICQFLLNEHQIYVQPINYPTVPKGTERLRLTPGPFHSDRMINNLIEALQSAFCYVEVEMNQQAS